MKARDLMKTRVLVASPDASIQDCARTMRDELVGFLPICEESGRIFGTLTDRDITCRAVAEGVDYREPIRRIATRDIVACSPDDDLSRAEELMAQNHVSRLLVVEDDNLVGVISLSDIVEKEDPARALRTLREVASREVSGAHA